MVLSLLEDTRCLLSKQATGTRFSDADRFQRAPPPQRHPHTQLRGVAGLCAGTSVVSTTGPPLPVGHTAGSVENSRGKAAQPPEAPWQQIPAGNNMK